MYCAFIGDIVKSKDIADRSKAQEDLFYILNEINKKYIHNIASKFIITLGDEFQGVLKNADSISDIIEDISFFMFPIKIRFGIGFGDISTELDANRALGADGTAFYAARDAIDIIKESENKYESPTQRIYLQVHGKQSEVFDLLNFSLSFGSVIMEKWTKRQMEIIKEMRKNDNNQSRVAQSLSINKSTVQKSLVSSKYYEYIKLVETTRNTLIYLWEDANDK